MALADRFSNRKQREPYTSTNQRMNSLNRATCLLRNTALAGTIAAILALQSASADITIASGATTNIDDSATTLVGTTKTFNETGICTLNDNSRLRANASQAGPTLSIVNNASIVFAGITPRLAFNDNDMDFVVNGPITNTSSGATTLAISTGSSGNGDRESVTFNSGIPDVGDGSPLGVTISFRCQSGSQSWVNLNAVNTFTGPLTLAQGGGPAAGPAASDAGEAGAGDPQFDGCRTDVRRLRHDAALDL